VERGKDFQALSFTIMPVLLAAMNLTFIYMNYRYRLEFLPLFILGNLAGVAGLTRLSSLWMRRMAIALVALLGVNVAISHLDLLQAKLEGGMLDADTTQRIARATWPAPDVAATCLPFLRLD
jgi:hypothetical protein